MMWNPGARPGDGAWPRLGVACIVKNEAPYLLEWVAHHRLMGVRRFFIADNRSTDGTTEMLQQLAIAGVVDLVDWPSLPGWKPQLPAYRYLASTYGRQVDWMAFIDADELIWPSAGNPGLLPFLAQQGRNVGAVALNWATYGASMQLRHQPGSSVERFTWHAGQHRLVNHHFKTIVRPQSILDFTCPHNVRLQAGKAYVHTNGEPKTTMLGFERPPAFEHALSQVVCWDAFRINHYVTRSWQEFKHRKSVRGRAFSSHCLDSQFFLMHNRCDEETLPSPDYLQLLQAEMASLQRMLDYTAAPRQLAFPVMEEDLSGVPILGHLDDVQRTADGPIEIKGWALAWFKDPIDHCVVRINGAAEGQMLQVSRQARPDVKVMFAEADPMCGFTLSLKESPAEPLHQISVEAVMEGGERSSPIIWAPVGGAVTAVN
ncbi:glycosyltransferase family 2 protein [Hydrogenophaga sp. 5NK40-0174]|uniref:glycosyltransferase family 2 protein n=1 Tax=Hydrogenophaga sp. 5NK40-0174 TaxID=3127649 RepID=UPI00310A6489